MKINIVKWITVLFLAALLINCAGNKSQLGRQGQENYFKGKRAFEKEKWLKAIDNFKLFLLNNPGSQYADSAQFLLGESYYNNKEYLMAISEYRQLTGRYSYSPLVEQGEYKVAKSYVKLSPNYHLDQKNTRRAIRYCQRFISNYPTSEYISEIEKSIDKMRGKLGHKLYKNGVLYRKMHKWEAAIIYFDEMLNNYYDTQWVLDTQLEKAYCLIKIRNFEDYEEVLAAIKDNNKDNEELQAELAELENAYQKEQKLIADEKEEKKGRF